MSERLEHHGRWDESLVGRLNDMARSVEGGAVDTAELAALLRGTADAIEALCVSLARFTEADSRWSGERIPRPETEVEG